MPHVAFVPFTGLRCREAEMLAWGLTLPGFAKRANALSELPALGLLTLAGMTTDEWSVSYHPSSSSDGISALVEQVLATGPTVIAVSALTASIMEAYAFCDLVRRAGVPVVIGGLHVTSLPNEATLHATSVCVGDGESHWGAILQDTLGNCLRPQYESTHSYDLAKSPTPSFRLLTNERSNAGPTTLCLMSCTSRTKCVRSISRKGFSES